MTFDETPPPGQDYTMRYNRDLKKQPPISKRAIRIANHTTLSAVQAELYLRDFTEEEITLAHIAAVVGGLQIAEVLSSLRIAPNPTPSDSSIL